MVWVWNGPKAPSINDLVPDTCYLEVVEPSGGRTVERKLVFRGVRPLMVDGIQALSFGFFAS